MPSQDGRTAVVTGVSVGGLGHWTALELARAGARVVLAGRTPAKLDATAAEIRAQVPGADLVPLTVDLMSLASVRAAAEKAAALGPLDLLVNNAGIMATPYVRTADGFEQQMATNHFGPFLLTGLLLPQLRQAGELRGDARVVAVASQFHRVARRAPLDDPRRQERRYLKWFVYGETKLSNLLFTLELDRRLRAAGLPVSATAAHPGFAATHLTANGRFGGTQGVRAAVVEKAIRTVAQTAHAGALPTLMAATADLAGGTYCGPSGPGEMRGLPQVVGTSALARDEAAARRLWEISEQATGLRYP